jgi:anti-sigma factor RsiW
MEHMKCAQVERLVDALVDGRLAGGQRAAVEEHAAGCERCTRSIRRAREIREAFRVSPAVRAPAGFAERVMARVYQQALREVPLSADRARAGEQGVAAAARAARAYRRMGLSFLLTAGVLAVSLLIPRIAYPAIVGRQGTQIAQGSESVVRGLLSGAEHTDRGALGESGTGGDTR